MQKQVVNRRRCLVAAVSWMLLVLSACTAPDETGAPGSPTVNFHQFDTPQELGTGLLDGATPDGSALYIEEPDPALSRLGCEGRPEAVMFRAPLDGGDRTVVAGDAGPIRGRVVPGGSGGRVAVVAGCESFFSRLVVARQAGDGSLAGLKEVVPQVPEGFLLNISTLNWSRDGKALLAAVQDIDAPDGDPAQIVSIDPGSGRIKKLFDAEQGTGVFNVGQMQNGDYVVATNLVVSFRDSKGVVKAGFQGQGFEISPDRRQVVVFGRNVRLATQGSNRARQIVPEKEGLEVSAAAFSPDATAIVFERYSMESGQAEISLVTPHDRKLTNVVIGAQYDRPFFTGDGKALAFNLYTGEPEFATKVYVTRFKG
jgi:hypothetical protein